MLFLATLGVYIGLLMAGASPGIIAQQSAAMTRNFDVTDEIEVKDDLDNKPQTSEDEFDDLVSSYLSHVESFVRDLRKLHLIEKLDSTSDAFETSSTSYLPCPETGGVISHDKDSHIDRWVLPAIIEAKFVTERLANFGDCLPFFEFANRVEARSSGVRIVLNKDEFVFESSIFLKGERSEPFYRSLQDSVSVYKVEEDSDVELKTILLTNTSIRKADSNVLLVTRLPRAGLNALLTKDAK